ncbi:hypothetical protein [Metabacillus sp. RGM 3146]|uniref:hypothetical protein n=1 Tax=Metabacillus sp. RGM 3146 TaxID=3401092 RepID=UPI003B9D98EE
MYSEKEKAVIEQAIISAIAYSSDGDEIEQYTNLLNRFRNENAQIDGFRYDYDDSSY